MSAGHTPGPWVVCVEDESPWGAHEVFAEHQLVNGRIEAVAWDNCVASAGLNHDNYEANARLIAAAPDMLEALTMVRDADDDCWRDGLPVIPGNSRAKIDVVIAKATGAAS